MLAQPVSVRQTAAPGQQLLDALDRAYAEAEPLLVRGLDADVAGHTLFTTMADLRATLAAARELVSAALHTLPQEEVDRCSVSQSCQP